jgi:aryl-alcohol dehydrogenase-like predicted oxidoreductase
VVNELIRDALYPYPEHLKLVTKVGGRRDDAGGWLPAQSPAELRVGVEDNLRTLQLERIDLVNLRLFDEHDAEGRLAERLGALEDLRQEGKLDLIGISNATTDTIRRALELVDIACVQNAYSIVNRAEEDGLALCEEHKRAFVPFFPLGSAFHRRSQAAGGRPGYRGDRRSAARHPLADRAGVAASPVRADPADPRHQLDPAPRGEHRRRRHRARRARYAAARGRHPSRRPDGRRRASCQVVASVASAARVAASAGA